ncbi:Rv1733c family protein [Geodermatophilus sabuli]|uniref:Transmembrane protein n=1 Tax=Geodermatophilus sabuli TaxID=1564158 RepID=A0A285EE24_9ACTN|nr:hypothetical protein [Geodermatophilus sabuli]MBB3084431.1 hypothetical protein [Geodermatophilus sabuli]SNX96301.1 hypothetical protein SAMN06893097_10415 [Geodermatophilus sabuli]
MSTRQIGSLRRAVRWFTLGAGPLKRGSDRVELLWRVVLLAVVLLALPTALTVGTVIHTDLRAEAAEQAATTTHTSAVLLDDVPSPLAGQHGALLAPARWTGDDGLPHEGRVQVSAGARAGDEVPVWLDASGAPTRAPLEPAAAARIAVASGFGVLLVTGAAVAATHLVVLGLLARHRDRRWTRGWADVEPVWARRVP